MTEAAGVTWRCSGDVKAAGVTEFAGMALRLQGNIEAAGMT